MYCSYIILTHLTELCFILIFFSFALINKEKVIVSVHYLSKKKIEMRNVTEKNLIKKKENAFVLLNWF